ncbi:MAG: bifunctional glutamate N-acetyltransferase/amino-acid acetyltransferase ArgJ [Propionibacteriaceae bacterium]|jgi:glutamate N-acetyltransferase/amino-acid N-acetyltransferase|nr:bifunctional glutamate N-acetyltransferase/amino-acid acetyltransferase ArgJ [Propionibacteriaceae bacterium]
MTAGTVGGDLDVELTAGVTAAAGFAAAGVAAGIRSDGREDLALVVNRGPEYQAAGVFTTNRVFAAPVDWSRRALRDGRLKAVVLNSGCANACTGRRGRDDAAQTAAWAGERLAATADQVAVCSTGLIGSNLPMERLRQGLDQAVAELSEDGGPAAARAILTTDTRTKQAAWRSPAGWTVGGMAKGAGMLAPGLATMLVLLTTDAVCDSTELEPALWSAAAVSFDRLDSDGCMSTNDAVLLLASGACGIVPGRDEFERGLTAVCLSLARQLIADAEGAEHDIAITVSRAASQEDAVEVARAVARSNLFKCAVAGRDPNWGRIMAAVGTTRAAFDPDDIDVSFNGVTVFRQGAPDAPREAVDLGPRQVELVINLRAGDEEATVWTNDLTHGYVSENADYSS